MRYLLVFHDSSYAVGMTLVRRGDPLFAASQRENLSRKRRHRTGRKFIVFDKKKPHSHSCIHYMWGDGKICWCGVKTVVKVTAGGMKLCKVRRYKAKGWAANIG